MVFSNLIFLYLFLPDCLIAYFFCPGIRAKNAVLILFSLIFYAWGEPEGVWNGIRFIFPSGDTKW